MTYEQKVHIPSQTKTVKHEIAACVKCGNKEIVIYEYEDQYGCISHATCPNCKQQVRDNTTAVGVIKQWNERNDIERLLIIKAELIEKTNLEIKALKELKRQRTKTSKGQ